MLRTEVFHYEILKNFTFVNKLLPKEIWLIVLTFDCDPELKLFRFLMSGMC